MLWFYLSIYICGLLNSLCLCDERTDIKDEERKFPMGNFNDPLAGLSNYFKSASDGVRGAAESGMGIFKGFGDHARDMTETSADVMKGFLGGIGEHFNKAKEVFEEGGLKIKESFESAADRAKEFGTVGQKSKETKEMSDVMSSFFTG